MTLHDKPVLSSQHFRDNEEYPALNVHDADVHRTVFNQFIHYDTDTITTLSTAATAGDNQLNLADASAFVVGDEIKLENGNVEPVFFSVKAITVNLVTIDTPLTFSHPIGSTVTKIHTNMAETGLTLAASIASPVIFTSHIPEIAVVHITSMSIIITSPSAMDFTTFGGQLALANGCVPRAQSDGFTGSFTNWKRNLDMDSDAFPLRYQEKVGGGEHGLAAAYQIRENTGSIVYLDGSKGDNFELLIQDSLETNTVFRIKLQGHFEGM